MDDFIALSPIPGTNGFENRMGLSCHSPITTSGEFTESSGSFLSTLMDSGGDLMVSDNADIQGNIHQGEKYSGSDSMDILDPATLHSFINQDQSNICDQKPFQNSGIPLDNETYNCENCGRLMRRRLNSMAQLQRFCSNECAKLSNTGKKVGSTEIKVSTTGVATTIDGKPVQINWDNYLRSCQNKMAPMFYFRHNTIDVPGVNPGMKLEAIDKHNPQSFCVATVVQVVGHRLRFRYDGYGRDSSHDVWCNFQAEELHPIGWCAQNGFPLQPPNGISCTLEEWRTFLTQTLTGALAAPRELFRKEHLQPRVHGFKVGMKLEVIHPAKPSVICPATVVKSLGPYYFLVATDYIQELPSVTFCCHSDSNGIFPAGWSYKNGIELTVPSNYAKKTFSWEKYMAYCHATYAPQNLFKKPKSHKFKAGLKLEAVDLEERSIIRVATITNVMGRVLQLFFDGQSRFQFVECDCPDMYPIGWCRRTGHPLHTEYGKSEWCKRTGHPLYREYGKLASKTSIKPEESQFFEDKLKLISFNDVISRKTEAAPKQSSSTSPSPLATQQRKPTILSSAVKPVEIKDDKNEKCQPVSPSDDDDDISDDEGNGTGSERFYHNKNQIFFNKSCCSGPLLNPEEVKLLPDATEPGKVSTVIRTGLEKVARCAKDPEKVMDMMQEGSGVRVVLKHKGKILKKAISRMDSRPKLERYLKRFCRRLVCCEYFLSLTPVASPCPDKCKADEHGNLQGPKGLKAKRSREYFETKHLGYEKKKRGRKSKSDLAACEAAAQRAAAGIVTTVFHKGDRVPLPNLDLPVTAIADHLRNTANKILNQTGQPQSENRILPKPVLSSTTILTHTNPPVSITNSAPPAAASAVLNFGKPRLLPSPCQTTNTPRTGNPSPTAEPQIVRPIKNAVLGRPSGTSSPLVPAMTRGPIVQPPPISPATPTHHVVATSYAINTSNKQPLLPQPTIEQGNVVSSASVAANTKPVFRLAAPKFTASHVARSTNPTQSKFPARLLAVRQPLPRGVSYRFALPPGPKIISSQANMVTTHHALPVSTSLTRVGPPPLIPARSLSAMPNNPSTSQGIQVMKTSPQDVLLKKVVTAAPNVCVTDRGTFTTQMSKVAVSANTANPIIGQSPDANAMMNKMFSVVKYSENGVMLTQAPASVVNSGSHTQSSRVNKSKAQDTKAQVKSTPSGPSLQKLSINVGGGMGAVTTAVRAGLVPKEDSRDPTGSSDPREKSITEGGGFSITINDNHLESSTTLADGTPNESETNDADDGKIEGESEGVSKRALWLHRRRKKKKVRFTYVKGKARKKKEDEFYCQINDDNETKQQEPNVQTPEQSVLMKTLPLAQIGELPKRGRPSKVDEKEGKRRGRPPKRSYLNGEDLEDEKDPLFTPPYPVQVSPKRFQRPSSYPQSAVQRKYHNIAPPSRAVVADVNNTNTPTETTTATTTCMTSPKAELMKGVLHAVQSSQHPSVKLRSPLGKQNQPINGFSGPPPKRSRLLSSGSPTSRKPRGFYSTSPKFSNAVSPRSTQKRIPTFSSIGTNTSLPGCSSDVCIYHPQNPKAWTIEQVAEYVRATDCKNYATLFMDQEVDGESLLLLTRNALMQFTNMKLGPTLKMSNYIAQLRARASSLNDT